MIEVYGVIAGLCFAAAVIGWSLLIAEQKVADERLASYKRVGTWLEGRVAELENENRQLAGQIVEGLGRPPIAMPIPPTYPDFEYAYDGTGLVQERLDPRDVPWTGQ